MADIGHELTEDMLAQLEKRIAEEYRIATREVTRKYRRYLDKTYAERQVQRKLYKEGKITKQEFADWCYRHEMMGKRWEEMKEVLAQDFHRANEIALQIVKQTMPDVYALNANYGTYQIEQSGKIDTGFTLYNHDTAEYLLGDQRQLMPKPSTKKAKEIAAKKDLQWNKQKIQSAVLQGVLQGEDPHEVAHRLQQVGQMNYNSAVRYARTMTTSAQNAGRYEAFRRADKLGVELTIEWQATLDHRTRHEHRLMHGQRTEVNKPFHTPDGYTILYPADCTGTSTAPQSEIWNCRCTLLSWVKGFEGETLTHSDKMEDMTFEEWLKEKAPKTPNKVSKPKVAELTFVQKVEAIKKRVADSGEELKEADIKEAGKLIADDYNAQAAERARLLEEEGGHLRDAYEKAYKDYREVDNDFYELRAKRDRGKITEAEWQEYYAKWKILNDEKERTRKEWNAVKQKYYVSQNERSDWLKNKLSEVRDMGSGGISIKKHLNNSGSSVVPSIQYAYDHYPTSWVEKSVARGNLIPRKVDRGFYSDWGSEIRISGWDESERIETAFHELGHRFERAVPEILSDEKAFYDRRTAGCAEERLCDIFKGQGYNRTEVTKKDNFQDAYTGKSYGGRAYELVSMGFEQAYTDPDKLAKDPDFQQWIYGLLILR